MKKLIALIGAVAMSFGLFADATPYAVSFEANDPGVSGGVFTPGEGWTAWTGADPFTINAYAGDGYLYPIEGAAVRRSDFFEDKADQTSYLKLETGTNTLTRAVGEGNVFLDQLVKFTGFEEPQTNLVAGTKVAVWMSGVEAEDGIEGETNLYVTCAKVTAAGVEQVALKLAAPGNQAWETEKWYRLTIKSIGDIYGDAGVSDVGARAGFIVYIDGTPVASSDAAAKSLIEYNSEMTTQAKGLMMNGQLFPAVDTANAVFASVGYQGIGAVDDIILDEEGPAFCAALNFNVVPAPGLKIVKVETAAGEIFAPYAVVSGTGVTITFGADDGWKVIKGSDKLVVDATISTEGQTVNSPAEGIETAEVVAQIIRDEEVAAEFAQVELDTAFALVKDGDQIKFVKGCSAFSGNYVFPIDTTIDVTAGGNWDIKVPGEGAALTDKIGAAPEKQITVTFTDDAETSALYLQGNIYGNGRVDTLVDVNGITMLEGNLTIGDTFQAEDGEGAILQSDIIYGYDGDEVIGGSAKITLVGKGKVVTQDLLPETAFTAPAAGFEIEETSELVDDTTWYTYALKGIDLTATFVIAGEDEVTTVDVQTVAYGATPTNVVVDVKGFKGWDPAIDAITEDTVYTAVVQEATGFAIIIADAQTGTATTNYYETLDAAIAAYEGEGAVTLLANCERADWIVVDKAVAIDLNGYSITVPDVAAFRAQSQPDYTRDSLFVVLHGGALTIDDTSDAKTGLVDVSSYEKIYSVVKMTYKLDTDDTKVAAFTLNGGTLKGYYYGITGSGNAGRGNTTITINGGSVIACNADDSIGIYNPQGNSTLTINGGTVQGASGVYIKAGICKCEVGSDATIKGVGAKLPYTPNSDGCNATGDAIILDNCGYPGGSPLAEIEAGTFVSDNAAAVASYAKPNTGLEPVVGFVSGGKFKGEVALDNAIVKLDTGDTAGKWVTDEDGYLVPYSFVAVAQVGDEKYETLAEAVAAANAGDEVTLLADTTLNETLTINKALAFNLNDKTITFGDGVQKGITTEPAGFEGDLVISNGAFAVAGTRPAKGYAFVLYRVDALIKDVEMDLTGFEYGLEAETMLGKPAYWTDELQYTITCENVDVTGNGSLFHFENVIATLDEDCSATLNGTPFGSAHNAAIYSSCGALVTVAGGSYEQQVALQTGNLGGDIVVNGGTFKGDIKSFMGQRETLAVEEWTENVGSFTITDGQFDGNFVEVVPGSEKTLWNITGGKFKADPTAYLDDDYVAIPEEGWYSVVQSVPEVPVAKIGDKEFSTLAAAFEAAGANDKVEMLSNVELDSALIINEKDVTFDLGGFTLKAVDGYTGDLLTVTNSLFEVTNGVLNVAANAVRFKTDSTVKIAQDVVILEAATYKFEVEGGTLNFYGVITNTQGKVPAIHTATPGSIINIYEGAEIVANGDTIRSNPTSGEATINIYGGTLTPGQGYPTVYAYNDCVTTFNVYGGTLNHPKTDAHQAVFGLKGNAVVTPLTDACTAKFGSKDGTGWSLDRTLADWCASGFAPVLGQDGYYTIQAVYNVTIAPAENGTVETSVTNNIVEGTEVTITATPATGYEIDTIAVTNGDAEVKVENNKFAMPAGNVKVYATFKSTAVPEDWEHPVVPIGETTTAAEAWPSLAEGPLANANAGKLKKWAETQKVDFSAADEIKVDAFLLNCENTDAAVAEAKAAFKIPAITINGDTVTVTEPTGEFNGTIKIMGSTTVDGAYDHEKTTGDKFFKAVLSL